MEGETGFVWGILGNMSPFSFVVRSRICSSIFTIIWQTGSQFYSSSPAGCNYTEWVLFSDQMLQSRVIGTYIFQRNDLVIIWQVPMLWLPEVKVINITLLLNGICNLCMFSDGFLAWTSDFVFNLRWFSWTILSQKWSNQLSETQPFTCCLWGSMESTFLSVCSSEANFRCSQPFQVLEKAESNENFLCTNRSVLPHQWNEPFGSWQFPTNKH